MIKLINCIHATPLVSHEKVEYVNYIQYDPDQPDLYKLSLIPAPVFVVGYRIARDIYGDIDILCKTISESVVWEFAYEENRGQHIDGVFDVVYRRILDIRFNKIKYQLIDPVFSDVTHLHQIRQAIGNVDKIYQYKDMLYAYNSMRLSIYGVDLKAYEFFGFDKNIVQEDFYNHSRFKHLDVEGDIFVEYKLQFPYVPNLKRYLVLLLQTSSN